MMSLKRLTGFAVAVLVASTLAARAEMLTVVGGTDFTLPGTGSSTNVSSFNPVNFSTTNAARTTYESLDGGVMRQGSSVKVINGAAKTASNGLSVDERVFVTFTYMLKEAGFTNVLLETVGGPVEIFRTGMSTIGQTSSTFVMGPGFLKFRLQTAVASDGTAGAFLDNDGAASSNNLGIAYSAGFNGGRSIIVGFDDAGAGPDRDYDDLVFRVDISAVPLPAAAWLLLAGISGLGLVARRRKAA
jgi:hypothetical protein